MLRFRGLLTRAGRSIPVEGLISGLPNADGQHYGLIMTADPNLLAQEAGPMILEIEEGRTGEIVISGWSVKGAKFHTLGPAQ